MQRLHFEIAVRGAASFTNRFSPADAAPGKKLEDLNIDNDQRIESYKRRVHSILDGKIDVNPSKFLNLFTVTKDSTISEAIDKAEFAYPSSVESDE